MINITQENDYRFMRVLPPERLQFIFPNTDILFLRYSFALDYIKVINSDRVFANYSPIIRRLFATSGSILRTVP